MERRVAPSVSGGVGREEAGSLRPRRVSGGTEGNAPGPRDEGTRAWKCFPGNVGVRVRRTNRG